MENSVDKFAPFGQAKNLRQGPCGSIGFKALNGAWAEDQHAMCGLAAKDFLPAKGCHIELVPR